MKVKHLALFVAAATSLSAALQAQSPMPTQAPAPLMQSGAMPMSQDGGHAGGDIIGGDMAAGGMYGPPYGGDCENGMCGPQGCDMYGCGPDCGHCGGGFCDRLRNCFSGCGLISHSGRGYLVTEAVMLNRSDAFGLTLARTVGTNAAILTANEPDFGYETLPRITAGYVLPNDVAIEGTVFYKDDFDATDGAFTGINNLYIPDPVGLIPSPVGTVNLALSTSIQNYEINAVETGRLFNFLAGVRYLQIEDSMRLNTAGGAGPTSFEIDTYNSMIGAQSGVRMAHDIGLFHIEGQGKAGMYFNNNSGTSTVRAGTQLPPIPRTADGDCQSFVGELSCMISYRPSSYFSLRAGYQVYWMTNVALAADQFAPNNPVIHTGVGINDRGDLMLHGPSAGLDFRF